MHPQMLLEPEEEPQRRRQPALEEQEEGEEEPQRRRQPALEEQEEGGADHELCQILQSLKGPFLPFID
jgi:hypothetical protein